jgi:hypothetical protein
MPDNHMSGDDDDGPPPLITEDSSTSEGDSVDDDDLPQLEAISPAESDDDSEYDSEYDDDDDDDDDDDYDGLPNMVYSGSESEDEYDDAGFLPPQLQAMRDNNLRSHQGQGSRSGHPLQQNPSQPSTNDPNRARTDYYPSIVVVADVQGAPFPVLGDQMDFESVWFGGNGIRFPAPFPVFQVRLRRNKMPVFPAMLRSCVLFFYSEAALLLWTFNLPVARLGRRSASPGAAGQPQPSSARQAQGFLCKSSSYA